MSVVWKRMMDWNVCGLKKERWTGMSVVWKKNDGLQYLWFEKEQWTGMPVVWKKNDRLECLWSEKKNDRLECLWSEKLHRTMFSETLFGLVIFYTFNAEKNYFHNIHNMSPGLNESLHLFWNLAYTFALDDSWWPWYKILFLYIGAQKYTFWKFALADLWQPWRHMMPKMLFSVHRNSKIDFLKICTWWPCPDIDLPWWTKCFLYA